MAKINLLEKTWFYESDTNLLTIVITFTLLCNSKGKPPRRTWFWAFDTNLFMIVIILLSNV